MNSLMEDAQTLKYIGKSHLRPDSKEKVTGETRFLTDIPVDNMLYAAPVFSSIPFGKIISIDTSLAEKVDGFCAFVSAKDIPGENQVGVIIQDQPLFADKTVRYIGDTVGLVIAETDESAHKSAKLVEIQYETYTPCLSIDASREAKSDFVHESMIACKHRVRKGNVNEGFKSSDRIIKAEFKTPLQEHYYLEPQGCIVIPRQKGEVTVIASLQCPFYIQKAIAKALALELSDVVVEQAPTGGAFGGKEDIPSELAARTAVAAVKLNCSIKMVYNRREDIQLSSKRHPFQMMYKVGVTNDGKLLAAEILLEENAGAYATLSSVVSYRSAAQAMGPYVVPNVKVDSYSYYTNLPPNGAFRGFGSPQAAFGHERMMDVIAEDLGMDPMELRLKNIVKPGDTTTTDQKLTVSVGAEETLIKAAETSGWSSFSPPVDDRYLHGLGMSTIHYGNCLGAAGWHMDGAAARIQILRNGSVAVSFGLVEMGQGALTVIQQMTADALGISPERISVLPTTTERMPDSGPSVASRNVVMTGNAIRDAADKLIPVLKEASAELLECKSDRVKISVDRVVDTTSGIDVSFEELAQYLYTSNRTTEELGWWHVRELDYNADIGIGEAYFTYSYATHIAKVRVDKLTGQVHVDKIWAAHDIGRAINPAGLEGQVEGGTAQGIGWAITEDFIFSNGVVKTSNLSTYLLPTAKDAADVETIIIEDPEPEGPWGAKGIGEPSIIPTGAAIANAASNAIGVQMNEIPLTSERVLNAINGKK